MMPSASSTTLADFSCAICLEIASEPVVTRCGHLFCWSCLDSWLCRPERIPECPVCKGRVDENIAGDIIPLYGKGSGRVNGGVGDKRLLVPSSQTASSQLRQSGTVSREGNLVFCPSTASAHPAVPAQATNNDIDGERNSTDAPGSARGSSSSSERPRPAAARAPTPSRPQIQRGHMRHNMPLQMGSVFFVFGSGLGMGFVSFLILLWGIYMLVPFRQITHCICNRLHRYFPSIPGSSENDSGNRANTEHERRAVHLQSFATSHNVNPASRSREEAYHAHQDATAPTRIANMPNAEVLMRNICISIFVLSFIYVMTL